jgi:hypothetical protein
MSENKWRNWREILNGQYQVTLHLRETTYCRYIEFADEAEAALFKLTWSDALRIERYD